MKFNQDDVQKLADLARIKLSDTEATRMQTTLVGVLEYVNKIQDVDVSEMSDTESHLEPRVRVDEVKDCDERVMSRIISQFPDRENDALVVPAVFSNRSEKGDSN